MRNIKVAVLCGGVGASRLLVGLTEVVKPENIYAIVNTGDDINLLGFHISPDLDIVTYSLAGIVEKSRGWGVSGDTFNMLSQLAKYDKKMTWFNLGDKDLATHIFRTNLMNQGKSLSEVTSLICKKLKVKVNVMPMTNEPFETHIVTNLGEMHFQEYLVKLKMKPRVKKIKFVHKKLTPSEGVVEAIEKADLIIIPPSNPLVSIGPILHIKEVKEAIERRTSFSVAVSPIIGGKVIKGPLAKMLRNLKLEVSPVTVSKIYSGLIDAIIIDKADAKLKEKIEKNGIKAFTHNIMIQRKSDSIKLAKFIIDNFQLI